jgi:hypothetical protein
MSIFISPNRREESVIFLAQKLCDLPVWPRSCRQNRRLNLVVTHRCFYLRASYFRRPGLGYLLYDSFSGHSNTFLCGPRRAAQRVIVLPFNKPVQSARLFLRRNYTGLRRVCFVRCAEYLLVSRFLRPGNRTLFYRRSSDPLPAL